MLARQIAELTRHTERMAGELQALLDRADTQQERIDLAARELNEVSARLQAAANAAPRINLSCRSARVSATRQSLRGTTLLPLGK